MAEIKRNGVIVVNKPAGWTSHDVVARMRGIAGTRRVGHLGTLDPLATGVLPVMIGQATRLARYWGDAGKVYQALIRFGFATSTYDREGEPVSPVAPVLLTFAQVDAALAPLRGVIDQVPPPVSAKKINGVPAYKLARRNIAVELQPVRVDIQELTLQSMDGDLASVFVRCSSGTYIRSIAHDVGRALGCGAHIAELTRAESGPFSLAQAFTLDELQSLKDEERLDTALLPAVELLPQFPAVYVDDLEVLQIRRGKDFQVSPFRIPTGTEHVKAVGPDGGLIAIGRIVLPNVYHPVVVLAEAVA